MTGNSLRIAMLTPGYPPDPGGVENVVGNLARELAASGHRVDVLAATRHGETPSRRGDVHERLVVRRFPDCTGSRRFEVAPGLWRHVSRSRGVYDVVHAHNFHASTALASILAPHTPLVFSPHYHGVGHTLAARALHYAYDPLAASLFRRATAIICVSQAEARAVTADHPACAERIVVVPNGVDVAGIARATPYPEQEPVFLVAGRLEDYKQVGLAIRGMAMARPELPTGARLVVLGDGPARRALEADVAQLGLANVVTFLGHVPIEQLRRWQRSAAVTIALSRHEAFGMGVLEAAAAGSRVVASAIPAHIEIADEWNVPVTFVPVEAGPADVAAALTRTLRLTGPVQRAIDIPTWTDVSQRVEEILRRAVAPIPARATSLSGSKVVRGR